MDRWRGRVALVTGASVGIGYEVCKMFVLHGLKVAACARNSDKIKQLSEELKAQQASGTLLAVKCDLTDEAQVLKMFEKVKKTFGGVDICVNNAGFSHNAPLLSGSTEEWREMMEVNVIALCVCTREAIRSMRERGVDDGHVIMMNSLSGHRVPNMRGVHFYAATKFAVSAVTEGIRQELRELRSHIRVSSISPGLVEAENSNHQHAGVTGSTSSEGSSVPVSASPRLSLAVTSSGPLLPRPLSTAGGQSGSAASSNSNSVLPRYLNPRDVVEAITYVLSAPAHVQVHDILLRPTDQLN